MGLLGSAGSALYVLAGLAKAAFLKRRLWFSSSRQESICFDDG